MIEKRYDIEYDSNCYMCILDCEKKVLYTDRKKIVKLLNEQNETITDNEEYIKDLEYQLKGFKKDYNNCGEYLKEYQQKVKDTLQWIYNDSKERQKVVKLIAKELGIDLQRMDVKT